MIKSQVDGVVELRGEAEELGVAIYWLLTEKEVDE